MAKNSITDYSKTAASNTDIQSVDIAEGCLPSGINNAIREIMADLADMNDGTVSLTSPSFAAASITGDLTVDTNTLHVDSTNNRVGIGTTSPSATVDVEGELIVTGGGTGTILVNDEDSSLCPTMTFTRNGGGTSTNDFIKFENSGGEVAAINTSGGAYFSNNVGIGTSSPANKLEVSGAVVALGAATAYTNTGLYIQNKGSSVFDVGAWRSGASVAELTFSTDSGSDAAPTERMRIDSSGRVGIGTSSPVSPLEIATTNKLGSTFTGTTNGEGLTVTQTNYTAGNYVSLVEAAFDDSNDVNPNVRIGAMFDGSGASLAFGTSNSYGSGITNTAMFINSSGNVGIGTSSPNTPLHVIGTAGGSTYAVRVHHDGNSTGCRGLEILSGTDNNSSTNPHIDFRDGDGTFVGRISSSNGTVTYGAFTAMHPCILPDADNDTGYPYGTLLETTSLSYTQKNDADTERGLIYNVRKTQSANSKAVLGAYGSKEDATEEEASTHQVLVLGDGHILCNNSGGNISMGDGICSSAVAGIGQKATANPSMIIGIAQEDVTFTDDAETKLVAVQYGLQQFVPWS